MTSDSGIRQNTSPGQREQYINRGDVSSEFFAKRSAESQASFLLPHLRPGMTLLDCGCGPGTITVGLASTVAPGMVFGIDIEPKEVERAKALAAQNNVSNIKLESGSVYELPYENDTFDAVFSNTVIEHLREPVKALEEIRRVLKSGGVVGVRDADWGGYLMAPPNPVCEELLALRERVWRHNGGDPRTGRRLIELLRLAGFSRMIPSASYEVNLYGGSARDMAEGAARYFSSSDFTSQVVELGWYDSPTLESMSDAWREWGQHPDAFFARAYCAAVAWKE